MNLSDAYLSMHREDMNVFNKKSNFDRTATILIEELLAMYLEVDRHLSIPNLYDGTMYIFKDMSSRIETDLNEVYNEMGYGAIVTKSVFNYRLKVVMIGANVDNEMNTVLTI
jgi:hypothetical protein